MDDKIVARFWSRVDKRGDNECWPWTAGTNKKGYGHFWDGSRTIHAHVVSAMLAGVKIPAGMQCAHSCHNPPCCNPKHLHAATGSENVSESVAAGRRSHLIGARHNRAKLTDEDAREILRLRALGKRELAERFGVCGATISHLLTGRNWKHLKR